MEASQWQSTKRRKHNSGAAARPAQQAAVQVAETAVARDTIALQQAQPSADLTQDAAHHSALAPLANGLKGMRFS